MAAAAAKFGGGGHVLAAGCTFFMPLEEAEKLFIPVLIDTVNAR
jgi:nanoRNase/pAp phosphatase (c-di-AMP/oligoRNAs hydrolase)